MIKEVLQQLEPLDAQIDALCSSTDDAEMANTTTHAAELAELSAQENMLLQRCTSLTPEDRVFLARRPDRPHIGEIIDNLFTDFFERGTGHRYGRRLQRRRTGDWRCQPYSDAGKRRVFGVEP